MLLKQQTSKLPEAIFVESKSEIKFREGYVPFAEKIARAKEELKNVKLPPR